MIIVVYVSAIVSLCVCVGEGAGQMVSNSLDCGLWMRSSRVGFPIRADLGEVV